jgi:subtilisin family serine protease
VFDLAGPVAPSSLRAAGLTVLGGTQGSAVVAFADDPQLHAFLERVQSYRDAEADVKYAPNEGFVDVLSNIRLYAAQDRLTRRLRQRGEQADGADPLDLQIDLWHPGDRALAEAWIRETADAVLTAGGNVRDRYVNHRSGLLLIRATVPAAAVAELAEIDEIALIDGLPSLSPSRARPRQASVDQLPDVPQASSTAPLVGLIDSGVRSAHPMLAPGILDAVTLSGEFEDGEDENGHGTRIAGLLLHGQLEDALEIGLLPRPFCRLLSVRVLGANNQFPLASVWEAEVEKAIRHCAAQGARVINLSIGDEDTAYEGARSTPLAAILDELTRELGLILVVPTGNVALAAYLDASDPDADAYVEALLASAETTMLDPAPAVTALTVGALAPEGLAGSALSSFPASRRALGRGGWPAPFSRRGPGIDGSIKPELSAVGGSIAIDAEFGSFVDDDALGVVSTSGHPVERLLDIDIGTSFAVPLVARVAACVLARYPEFSANLVRALTLLAADEPSFAEALGDLTPAAQRTVELQTVGYGVPRLTEAVESTPHRTILVAEGEIKVDTTMIYEIPIPTSFGAGGGARGIDIALAFDPETRARRLDYAATKMEFWLVRGMSAEEITEVFTSADPEELERLESTDEDVIGETEDEDEEDGEKAKKITPSRLKRKLVNLSPNVQVRSRGANQLGRVRISQRLPDSDGDSYYLVVQCRRVWASSTFNQSFAIAVALSRDEDHPPIYEELRARTRVAVEVPIEIELRR